mmetsp:Transcript_2998/g.6531  ORF Transcript_2998/g.6531 Transcript_2998/m.6531 type:complete len:287 (-) Transcript_2998:110-970(-)
MANNYDEAIYYNNLALLHQSAGKIHLALRYYSYALSYMEHHPAAALDDNGENEFSSPTITTQNNNFFWSNGLARPNISVEILNNMSVCAFQAQEFTMAYECMARCVKMSPGVFGKRGRCWLRLGQSCIGIYTKLPQTFELKEGSSVNGLDSNYFGSEEDLSNINISTNPLQRASFCLYRALHLSINAGKNIVDHLNINESPMIPSPPKNIDANADMDCYEMALVSLAYVKLQLKDFAGALEITKCVLLRRGSDVDGEDSGTTSSSSLQMREMAKVYYREAAIQVAG